MQHGQGQAGTPDGVDESRDLDFGMVDVVGGILTAPLLLWVLMYAVTGHERLYATRAARLRVYVPLLVVEALVVAGVVAWKIR